MKELGRIGLKERLTMALVGCQWGYGLRDAGGAATPGFMDGRSYGPFVASVGAGPVVILRSGTGDGEDVYARWGLSGRIPE